ncbi:MAG: tRNA (adenosine(37)-N6)-threonylcarbamoyltransferase complex dimerization subunit type 1 TsaB [Chitinophagales bacterium]|jgi:tRNA threonylcarbamoyladenosine biosynthesis protein TsaB|nr:tRNA (adenosine(37)-N6)-threonylcarbamoyltransferase complex dimerization subunit type 1 TsaB [Chitinophagales bacterium]
MPSIICIETSSVVCSIALIKDGRWVGSIDNHDHNVHAQYLTTHIAQLLEQQQLSIKQLNAIAISSGPGSYTGLRIATSVAKGLCYAANIPLIAIPTLSALAHAAQQQFRNATYYIPMIDARRMEVYTAIFDTHLQIILAPQAIILPHLLINPYLDKPEAVFCGNGANKILSVSDFQATYINTATLNFSANHLTNLALLAYQNKEFVDIAYFEPFYLKNNY